MPFPPHFIVRPVRDGASPEGFLQRLVDRCAVGDGEAWRILSDMIAAAAVPPIRRLLAWRGIDATEADDLVQDLYLELMTRSLMRLRACRCEGETGSRRFLRVVAMRFMQKRLMRRLRADRREARAILNWTKAVRGAGPTEAEAFAALGRLAESLDDGGRARLRALLDPSEDLVGSERTRRRWAEDLSRELVQLNP